MPQMSGFDLCRKIRETYTFPVIMLTAKVEDMDKIMDESRLYTLEEWEKRSWLRRTAASLLKLGAIWL